MPKIVWDESFSVNNVEIDNQHKKWIEIANELHESLMAGKDLGNVTGKTLDAMVDYAQFHFSYEEDYMKKNNYSDLIDHVNIHSDFMRKIEMYRYENQLGITVLNRTIMKELMDWLWNHILKMDKQYVSS